MAIGVGLIPYVHSHLYNLYNPNTNFKTNFDYFKNNEYKEAMDELIGNLTIIRDNLKNEAEDFLGPLTAQQALKSLNNASISYQKIGIEILNSEEAIAVLGANEIDASKLNFDSWQWQVSDRVKEQIRNNISMSLSDVASIVSSDIAATILSAENTVKGQRSKITQYLGVSEATKKRINEAIKGRISSEKGKIKEIVKTELLKRTRSTNKVRTRFISFFEKKFKEKLAMQTDIVYPNNQTPEDYLEKVKKGIQDLPADAFQENRSNIIGKLGEDFFKVVEESDANVQIQIVVTGTESEQSLLQKGLIDKILKTHHDPTKESQTDMLLTHNGKTVRVQSKNLQSAYQSVISDTIDAKPIPGIARIQDTVGYLDLIDQLDKNGVLHLSNQDLANINYLLANEMWFRIMGTVEYYTKMNEKGEKEEYYKARGLNSKEPAVLKDIAQKVNNYFTKEIQNFIGLSIDENIKAKPLRSQSDSNVFYLVSNVALVPVYAIIDDLIKKIQEEDQKFSLFSVTLNRNISISGDEESFWKAKEAVLPDMPEGEYTYQNPLLGVGAEKGSEIMHKLKIQRMNLNFDLDFLINSAWPF